MSPARTLYRNPHYRRLFLARTISNVGNGIAPIALAFGVLALPNTTPTSLSIVLAAQAIPLVVVLPLGGVIADRVGRARVIATTDMILSAVVFTMAALFMTGNATVANLAVLNMIAGVLTGLWYPAFPGLVPEVITDEELLQPANAYVGVGANTGLIVGSAIGGVLVATFGSGVAIAVDGLSFLLAGALVFSFRHLSRPHESGESVVGDLVHGWRVFLSFRWIVVIVAAFSVVIMVERAALEVMGPVLANEVYGGPAGWSLALAALSVGLLVGGFGVSRLKVERPMVVATITMFTMPVLLVCLALEANLVVISIASFALGIAYEFMGVLWFTALQTNVPRESISRVSAYDAMGSLMLGPIGLALAGPLIDAIGLTEAFLAAAVIVTAMIAAILLSPSVRALRSQGAPTTEEPAP